MVEVPPAKKIKFAPFLFFLLAVATVYSKSWRGLLNPQNHFEGVQIFSFDFKIR